MRFGSRCPCGAVGPGVRYNRRAACEGTDSRLPNTLGSGGQGDRRRTASEHHSAGPSTHTWAFRSFRDVADGDYIAARMACRAQLSHQFLWASQQAIEKYLKSALFLRRIPAKKVRHDLAPALKLLTDAGVGFTLSERSQKFVDRVDQMGQFRYMEVSQWVDWHWIVPLDQVVWELRRFSTLDPMATNARLIEGKWAPRVKIVGGHLERILAKRDNPAREALLWHNGYFGRGRRTIMVRSGITAVNFSAAAYDRVAGRNSSIRLHTKGRGQSIQSTGGSKVEGHEEALTSSAHGAYSTRKLLPEKDVDNSTAASGVG